MSVWRERGAETATCVRCLEVRDADELDRLLWCERCCALGRRRAMERGWVVGAVVTALLAVWIWLWVQPTLLMGVWLAILVAAFWLTSKIARELAYGVMRFRNRRAVEAVPPDTAPEPPAEGGPEVTPR